MVTDVNTVAIPEQPMPARIAEACGWLQAAESSVGDVINTNSVLSALVAGDALDVLLEVMPAYRPIPQPIRQVSTGLAIASARAALERAGTEARTVDERLRVARAERLLRDYARP
jgi:hypothetical protein